ncbi:hypothetical protein TWF718_010890 [Orbilia javanica]|uniref:AB hydrolase-1 domain-containing protein n=1 Tax=Orbilia javanica TaxID=47235 RepID=A0AAN8MP73_9PEZI
MTLRTKLAAFHARIHSHRHNNNGSSHHHFHLPHLKHKSSKDSKDKDKHSSSSSPSPSRKCSKPKSKPTTSESPSRKHSANRNSLSSNSTNSSTSGGSGTISPSPVLTLVIPVPSHHTHTIEARVYHPPEFPQNYGLSQNTPRKVAVVAHPYASLGGTWDDPVVLSLVALLARKGYVVATFNFCGAGNSKGKTSWTGEREREEYATVAAFVTKYVECIDPHTFTIGTPPTTASTNPVSDAPTTNAAPLKKQPIKVLLAGYSYGSLIASRTPPASRILKTVDKDILAYATRTAYEWASTEKRRSFAMVRGAALGRSVWANDDDDYEEECGETSRDISGGGADGSGSGNANEKVNYNVQLETESSWLLVSPLLPPVSMFLNLPNPMAWFPAKKRKEEEEQLEDEVEDERDVLAVYGTDDMFTGIGRYRNWVKGKMERSGGRFRGIEVDGAGHFWMQEEEWMVKLRDGVNIWIEEKNGISMV